MIFSRKLVLGGPTVSPAKAKADEADSPAKPKTDTAPILSSLLSDTSEDIRGPPPCSGKDLVPPFGCAEVVALHPGSAKDDAQCIYGKSKQLLLFYTL